MVSSTENRREVFTCGSIKSPLFSVLGFLAAYVIRLSMVLKLLTTTSASPG